MSAAPTALSMPSVTSKQGAAYSFQGDGASTGYHSTGNRANAANLKRHCHDGFAWLLQTFKTDLSLELKAEAINHSSGLATLHGLGFGDRGGALLQGGASVGVQCL